MTYLSFMDIKDIIKRAGGPAKVARCCGISSQAVSQWRRVPYQHVQAVSKLTGMSVKSIISPPRPASPGQVVAA